MIVDKITVKCGDKIVSRLFNDEGFEVNIYPFYTLRELGINRGKIQESYVKVGFNGSPKNVVGEIHLALQIAPVEFSILFQVMHVSSSYNILLGRPRIHMAG